MAAVAENGPPAKAGAKAKPIKPRKGEKVVLLSDKNTRSLDIHEGAHIDEAQTATWVKQAAVFPGWVPGRPS